MEKDKVNIFEWENWDKLTDSTAEFILSQAEKNLSELIVAADVVTQRVTNVMQSSFAILIALIGFLASSPENGIAKQMAIVSTLFLVLISFLSFRVYRLYKIKPIGNRPSKIITEEKTNHPNQYLVYLYNAIKTTEKAITFNTIENGKRITDLKRVFYLIWAWLAVSLCYYLIYSLCHL